MASIPTSVDAVQGLRFARRACGLVLLMVSGLVAIPRLEAQDNYEIQVYGADIALPRTTMVELHSNFTAKGSKTVADRLLPTNHAEHETLEITQGFTDWFETGFYLFTTIQADGHWQWVGDHIRPRVRIPDRWHWPVGLSLSLEFGYQRRSFSADTWTLEIRPIVDRKLGRWYVGFNPALEKSLHGENAPRGFEFAPAGKISYDFRNWIAGGLEYYGSTGPLFNWDTLGNQQHQVFPTVDLNVSPLWEINFGVGLGMTHATDRLIIKAILGRRFSWPHKRIRAAGMGIP